MLDSGAVDLDAPADSYLLELIASSDPEYQMPPPEHDRVPAADATVLAKWVDAGLPWEAGFTFALDTYEPPLRLTRPTLPPPREGRDHPVDRIVDAYLADRGVGRPQPAAASAFARRASLDLVGLLPTPEMAAEVSRDALVDELLADDVAYAEHWLTFYNDLFRNDYSGTGFITGGRRQISGWLYESLTSNKPFDAMARELIAPPTAASRGFIDGIKWRGEVSAGQTLPIQFSQSVSQSFLGINMKCASCHDSFVDRWTLEEAYGLAAVYADGPLEIHRCDKPTGRTATAGWPFPELGTLDAAAPREERLRQLAALTTSPENGRFARTIVNRLWHRLMGRGIVHPVDAMQTQPWSEPLLDFLASELVDSGYDLKHVLRLIATSEIYAAECRPREDAPVEEFAGPVARRMTAEQFLDAVWALCDAAPEDFEAPVFRGFDGSAGGAIESAAEWVWGTGEDPINPRPGGERVLLRKVVKLDAKPERAAAVLTCDNGFELYVNGRLAATGDDWMTPQAVVLTDLLKKGANRIEVIAANAGSKPNAAGFLFEARVVGADGATRTVASDASWEWTAAVPKTREGRLRPVKAGWSPVSVITEEGWTPRIELLFKSRLFWAETGFDRPVRAALLRNTDLMRSLGRPGREQIVSMRPDTLTTLEALDLANEPTLSAAFRRGGEHWAGRSFDGPDALVEALYREALGRRPTGDEAAAVADYLGETPTAERLQDVLWAVCLQPEFLLVR